MNAVSLLEMGGKEEQGGKLFWLNSNTAQSLRSARESNEALREAFLNL